MSVLYVALQPVDHAAHGRVYQAGETFDLDHLTEPLVQRLLAGGVVAQAESAKPEADESKVARATKKITGG